VWQFGTLLDGEKMNIDDKLWELAAEFRLAKIGEDLARKKRIALEDQIASLIPSKADGQKTITLKNGAKITVKRGLSYKADLEGVCKLGIWGDSPPPIKSKTTHELDIQGYEWYRQNDPGIFNALSQHVTVTPRKPSVTVKPAKEKEE